jgi:hypothetical protein
MNTETHQTASKADAEGASKARVKALDMATAALVAAVEQWPDLMHGRVVRKIMGDLAYVLAVDDPYDDHDDTDWPELLRDIRADLKAGDTEHALLLIHYQLGDY